MSIRSSSYWCTREFQLDLHDLRATDTSGSSAHRTPAKELP
ncbi:hypothetical protein OG462_04950 [Streptomyces sp. NBC_01077]|nr:hypothetical protein OG462_04950 [Streptomyces sp. NBC_01077]